MSGTCVLTIDDLGRLKVPIDVRDRRGLTPGAPVILVETSTGLVLLSRDEALAEFATSSPAPTWWPSYSPSDASTRRSKT